MNRSLLPACRLALATLAAARPVSSQEPAAPAAVSGAVTDMGGAPIRGAYVAMVGTPLISVTDAAGRYRLPGLPAGAATLKAAAIGFAPDTEAVELRPGDAARVDFVLRASPLELAPIDVTSTKTSRLVEHAVTSVAQVTEKDLARRSVNTVDEAVDKAPGVQFLNGQVNLRGSTGYVQGLNSRVLLLVDGVPMNQGDRGGIHWDLLPVDQIERVEVVKGAGSSLYGSAALGGVVNVITREIPAGFHARLRATGGAFSDPPHAVWRFREETGLHGGADVTASYGAEEWRGSFAAGGRHTDGYREQDERDHWQLAGKGEWHPSAVTQLTVSGAWAVDDYQVPLAWCLRGECDDRGQVFQPFKIDTTERGAHTNSRKGYLSATLARTPSHRLSWQARGSWLRTHFTDTRPSATEFAVSNRVGVELRAQVYPAETRVATVGAEGTVSDVTSDIFGNHSQGEYAAYGESEQRLGNARLTTGARIDFLAVDGGGLAAVLSPRLGAVLPSRIGIWRASAGRGFRAPTLAERFVHTFVFGFEVIPNPGLNPETAWSFELGNAASLARAARLDAAVFWTEAQELIEPTLTLVGGAPKIQLRNVSRARLIGLDAAMIVVPLPEHLTATVGYTLLRARQLARDTTPERPLAFRPRHLLTVGADYTWGPAGVGADFRFASRVERIELEGFVDDRRVAVKVLDLRASYARGLLSVRLLVANTLNYIYNLVPETLAPVRTYSVVMTWTY